MYQTNRVSVLMLATLAALTAWQSAGAEGKRSAAKRWRLAMQVYTFNRYTLFEALDKCKELGIKYVELYPGQRLSPENNSVKFDHNAPLKYREMVKKKLAETGIKAVCYGVVGLSKNEARNRKVFDFAKDMGIETINTEPPINALPDIDQLAQEYGINVGIHNHPKRPKHKAYKWWDPDYVLKAVAGCSKRIGSCADTGHWMRSDVDPLEAVKKLRGRIVSSHFKDLNKMGRPGEHDVAWGTGKGKVRPILEELKKQGYVGVFSIEYEHNWTSNMPELAKCVAWFNKTAAELYGK